MPMQAEPVDLAYEAVAEKIALRAAERREAGPEEAGTDTAAGEAVRTRTG